MRPNGPPGWHLKAVVVDGEDSPTAGVDGAGRELRGVRVLLTQAVTHRVGVGA